MIIGIEHRLHIFCLSSLNPQELYEKIQIESLLLVYVFVAIFFNRNEI